MKECYSDKWVTFYLDLEKEVFKVVWHDDGTLVASQYKEHLLHAKTIVLAHRPTKNLSDARTFRLAISPELQTWIAENIFQKKGEEIIKQYAFVIPQSIFAQISVEQMMEESDREDFTRYFDNMQDAEKWLNI